MELILYQTYWYDFVYTTTVGKPQVAVCSLGQQNWSEDKLQPHKNRAVLTHPNREQRKYRNNV